MRRLVLAILFVAAAGLALLFSIYGPEPGAPRFRPPPSQEAMRSFAFRQYEFLSPCPFEGGKMWILAWSGATNFHYLLFDIEQRRVIGELTNATPAFMNRDQTRLLCVSRGPARTLVGTFARLIERISWGGIRFPKPNLDTEVFWALDLNKNTSVRIGQSSQLQGQSSYFQPSPDFRLGHNRVWTGALTPGFLVCDLEKNLLTHINAPGVPAGSAPLPFGSQPESWASCSRRLRCNFC